MQVEARQAGGRLEVSVRDNGMGMDDERLAQVRSALTNEEASTGQVGYGLYSVDQRIKLHYNQQEGLQIFSEQGQGTTVSFSVPLRE